MLLPRGSTAMERNMGEASTELEVSRLQLLEASQAPERGSSPAVQSFAQTIAEQRGQLPSLAFRAP